MMPVLVFGCSRVNFLNYRIYNQVFQSQHFLSVMLFLHFSVSESFSESVFCKSSIKKGIVTFEFFNQKCYYKK